MKIEQNNVKSIYYTYIFAYKHLRTVHLVEKMNLRNDLFNLRYVARLNDWIDCHYDGIYIIITIL